VHFHCRQILLSTRQAAAQHRHGAGGAGHPLRLRQLSQQPGDQGRAAAHPQALRAALLLAHAGDGLLPVGQLGSRRAPAVRRVLETVSSYGLYYLKSYL